jgi:hypothetical membrane protein
MDNPQSFGNWRIWCFGLTFLTTAAFLFLAHLAMWLYKGGTIHEPYLTGYSFTYNFFSDLGRIRTPGGASNFPVNLIFRSALTLTGVCLLLFFSALPGIFKNEIASAIAALASLAGFGAGVAYIGIAWVPYDLSYGGHRMFVHAGFVCFLAMSVLYASAVFLEKNYPKRYGYVLLIFSIVLFSQILLMLYGDRSWRSNEALFRQATAQKVVVYSQVLCMLYQTFGAIRQAKSVA